MKKMSNETKYFIYMVLVMLGSVIAAAGSVVLTIRWFETLIRINGWLAIGAVGITAGLFYWMVIVLVSFTSSEDSQKEDC